ncbi:MAG: hypothetical protein PHX08_06715 [Lachnospiraceae bacterium]|nr:hypothetical protein [Lachnospiraceae bacterium]
MARYQKQLLRIAKDFCLQSNERVMEIILEAKNYEKGLIGILNVYEDLINPHMRTQLLSATDGRIPNTVTFFINQ